MTLDTISKTDKNTLRSQKKILDFVKNYMLTRVNSSLMDERKCIPPNVILDFGNNGVMGMLVSSQFEGLGLSYQEFFAVIEQIAANDLSLAVLIAGHNIASKFVEQHANSDLCLKKLIKFSTGRGLTGLVLTEPDAGSNPRAIKAIAEKTDDGWAVSGIKKWAGNASWSSDILIFAKTTNQQHSEKGMNAYLVSVDTPGIVLGPEANTLGLRATVQNTLFLNKVKVSNHELLGSPGRGLEIAQDIIGISRLAIGYFSLGAMKHCLQLIERYISTRQISTGLLLNNPVTRIQLTNIITNVIAIESLTRRITTLLDDNTNIPAELFMLCKNAGAEYLGECADRTVQLLGGRGYEETNFAPKILRDSRVLRIFEGPTETLAMHIGSVLIDETNELYKFLIQQFDGANIVKELKTLAAICNHQSSKNTNPISDNDLWNYYQLGMRAIDYVLLCSLTYEIKINPTQELNKAIAFLKARLNEDANCYDASSVFTSEEITKIIHNFNAEIGCIDQLLPGEDNACDTYLLSKKNSFNQQLKSYNEIPTAFSANRAYKKNSEFADHIGIHHLFEEQVKRTPNVIALIYGNENLTYQALNERANQLGRYILGAAPYESDAIVAILLERSSKVIIALLAALKAGYAYLLIQPSLPKSRIEFLLRDTNAICLISEKNLIKKHVIDHRCLIDLEENSAPIFSGVAENIAIKQPNQINQLAYVCYTSGSTGKPKGVLIEHEGLLNLAIALKEFYCLDSTSKVFQFCAMTFDVFISDVFMSLCSGACLYLPTLQEALPSEELVNALKMHQITHIQLPASVLASLPFVFLPQLKLIAVGGEVCPANTVKTWSKDKRFINLYGPTEATVLTTLFEYSNGELPMPIGRSIRNKKTYVLDEHMQPVKPGEIGELYIGGIGIARGYLNRSDITESSFIDDPFSTEPAAKLYKTGDLVKYQSDENLLFIGRVDNQVKLNGVRIELEEIETILLSIPQILHAALTLTNNEKGVQQLIAHVVLDNSAITLEQVKFELKSKLPTYMLPHRLRIIDSMPLTAAGKINRVELEKFKDGEMLQDKTTIELVGQTEKKLAAILQSVLGHAISREADFFEQGGNSLLATRVVALINKTFNQSFSVNLLFEKPTIADLSNEIGAALAKLKLESNSIDEINVAEQSSSKIFCIENVAIKKVSTQDLIPLSYAQEQLYILQMLYPDSTMYHQSVVISLGKAVKIDALETALNLLIENNDILRTHFQVVNGEPKQVISEFEPIHLEIKNLSDLPQNLADSQALRLASQLYSEPFNLTSDFLIRNLLIKQPNGNFKLYLVMHHIIGDGESLYNLFFPMLESNYIALTTEQNLPIQKHELQYADYSFWQRQHALDESNLNYWTVRLENVSTLKLHTRNSHSDLTSLEGAQRIFAIPQVLIDGLKKMAGETRSTLYMLIATVINILLYRYSNQKDICVGTFVSGRNKAELQNIMGDMRNTNILRTDLTGEPTFLELLERVKISVKDMVQHSNFPFQKLVKSSASQRSVTDNPFFQVALSYQPRPTNSSLGWQISNLECEATSAKFALTFDFEEVDNYIVGRIEYRTALFDKNTIEHMIAHLQNIISAVIENPKSKIDVIPILSEFERQQFANWNNTKSDYPQQSIQSIFEQQVEKFPNQTAVVFGEQQLTYSELNIKANQLAHTIRKVYQNASNKSVLPDTLIAVFMERSIELIIALVAILKAGGGYAPIDTDSPTDRIAYILDDLKVSLLVTETPLTKKLPMLTHVKTLCIDSEKWDNKSINNLADNNQPNDLAYVMYTSGSTGKPKGVLVTHKNVVRLVKNTNYLNFTTDLYIAQVSNIAFDAATFEIWGALLNGARLVITKKETLLDTYSFSKTLEEQKISTLFLTVALFNQFAKEQPTIFQNLEHLLIGGDAVNPATINQVLSHNKNKLKCIINCYGPTENTTFTTYYTVSSSQMTVPIGKPIANTQCYILDEHLNYVPIGVAGELYTTGDGLARGYLNLPELTMQRFLNNPFSDSPTNARLYRTGDLARWLPDGNIEFLGRADSQIKIRGHRIEPGEIEFALISHPAVKQAIVTTGVYESRGEKFLIAYFVKDRNHVVDVSDIKNYLNEKLPYYMIPAIFMEMESLPITQNGKIDRQKLPIPNQKSIEPNLYVAPRSRLELQLVKLWEQVLEVSPISVHDNFFELGGDSISLMSLNSLVDKECDVKLTFSSLFETPTVAQLAESIQKKHVQQSTKLLVKIQGDGNRQPLFCVPGAGGTVIYLNHLSRNLGKKQPFYAFEARGLENNGAMPFVTVEEMARSYVKELVEFYDNDSYILAGHSHGGAVCYEIAKTLQNYNKKVSFIFLFDAPVPTLGSDWGKDWDNPKWVEFIALDIENKTGKKLNITYTELAELSDEGQIDLFHQRLIDNSILSSKSRSGEAKSIIDVTRAADLSFLKYDCGNIILNTKFILIKAKESFFINDDYGILGEQKTQDPTWGWQRLSSLPVDICMVPGNHNSMLLPPNVEHITDILDKYLSDTN